MRAMFSEDSSSLACLCGLPRLLPEKSYLSPAQNSFEECHAHQKAVADLSEIDRVRRIVHSGLNFPDAGKRMNDDGPLFHRIRDRARDDVSSSLFFILGVVLYPFLRDARLIDDIRIFDALRHILRFREGDVVLLK